MGGTTHGKYGTKIYAIWVAMKDRCSNVKNSSYGDYGGRGISVQMEWVKCFVSFYRYVSTLPNYNESRLGILGLSLDRKDNNGNYCVGNVRWVDRVMQARNRRIMSNNTSGFVGVTRRKNYKKYCARITVNGKQINLGFHEDPTQAYELRKAYIIEHQLEGFEIDLLTNELKTR